MSRVPWIQSFNPFVYKENLSSFGCDVLQNLIDSWSALYKDNVSNEDPPDFKRKEPLFLTNSNASLYSHDELQVANNYFNLSEELHIPVSEGNDMPDALEMIKVGNEHNFMQYPSVNDGKKLSTLEQRPVKTYFYRTSDILHGSKSTKDIDEKEVLKKQSNNSLANDTNKKSNGNIFNNAFVSAKSNFINSAINWDDMIDTQLFSGNINTQSINSTTSCVQENTLTETKIAHKFCLSDKNILNHSSLFRVHSTKPHNMTDNDTFGHQVFVDKYDDLSKVRCKQKTIDEMKEPFHQKLKEYCKNQNTVLRKKKYTTLVKNWLNENADLCSHRKFEVDLTDNIENVPHKLDNNRFVSKLKQTVLTNKKGVMKFAFNANKQKPSDESIKSPECKKEAEPIFYQIKELNAEIIQKYNDEFDIEEITITIIFRCGGSQLNRNILIDTSDIPVGVMISYDCREYYYLNLSNRNILNPIIKQYFSDMFSKNIKIICYEAKELVKLLKDIFKFNNKEISRKWMFIDPKIGCHLLNPDNPPIDFLAVQHQLKCAQTNVVQEKCFKQMTAGYLNILNLCAKEMHILLTKHAMWELFIIESKLVSIIAVMEYEGIHVDIEKLKDYESKIKAKMESVEEDAYKSVGKIFHLNSPQQLRTILYDELKLDAKIKVRETVALSAKSTSESVLKNLTTSHPLPKLVLEYRHLHKALATYVTGISNQAKEGVIRPKWEQTAAATGRIACSNPNLQAIPKMPFHLYIYPRDEAEMSEVLYLRSLYIPSERCSFIAADFKHIECRILAHLSRDEKLLNAFRKEKDFFILLAAEWLQKSEYKISKDDRERTKRIVYAIMYGAGTRKIMEILNINYDQTLAIVSTFSRLFPSLKVFSQNIIKKCKDNKGFLETICGRRRAFPKVFNECLQAQRQAVNYVIQGSAADLCKVAMIETEKNLQENERNLNYRLIIQIHDELIWEVADTDLERVKGIIQTTMEKCGKICGMDINVPVSITCGKNWAEMQ